MLLTAITAILGVLLVQAWPALSWRLLVENPERFMTAGGVWAPTNYMTIRGLVNYGQRDFAHEAALNHLERMAAVHASRWVAPSEIRLAEVLGAGDFGFTDVDGSRPEPFRIPRDAVR